MFDVVFNWNNNNNNNSMTMTTAVVVQSRNTCTPVTVTDTDWSYVGHTWSETKRWQHCQASITVKVKCAIPHEEHKRGAQCSSPFLRLWAHRWINHCKSATQPVRRQTYGYLPAADPHCRLTGTKLCCMETGRITVGIARPARKSVTEGKWSQGTYGMR